MPDAEIYYKIDTNLGYSALFCPNFHILSCKINKKEHLFSTKFSHDEKEKVHCTSFYSISIVHFFKKIFMNLITNNAGTLTRHIAHLSCAALVLHMMCGKLVDI